MSRRTATLGVGVGVVVAAAGVLAASTLLGRPGPTEPSASPEPTVDVAPEILSAMQRDFGLTVTAARTRLKNESRASRVEQQLRSALADEFGGAWLNSDASKLTVAVTDAAKAATVREAGADVKVVTRSEQDLDKLQSRLDKAGTKAPKGITGWYVDVSSNSVVVLADKKVSKEAATKFAKRAGVDTAAVTVKESAEQPKPLFDVRGGDAYFPNLSRCSVGFAVEGGFVTAGHCGRPGILARGYNREDLGEVAGSSFPGDDYGWVRITDEQNWTPRGVVNRYDENDEEAVVSVTGSEEAAVGSSVCRSGSTSGWHCGTIQAKNATVRYPQGVVSGLTRTDACAEPGDSGGSWLSGTEAQGVTSGGSGNCDLGGTTYFQPINEILEEFDLTLLTSEPAAGDEDAGAGSGESGAGSGDDSDAGSDAGGSGEDSQGGSEDGAEDEGPGHGSY